MTVLSRFRELYEQIANLKVEQLDDIYHSDVLFQDPVTTHQGIGKVKDYFSALLSNAASCTFRIHDIIDCTANHSQIDHIVLWTMTLETDALNKGDPINLEGTSMLRITEDRIIFHRDYYDIGQMIYEHVPLLGFFVRRIKKGMSRS